MPKLTAQAWGLAVSQLTSPEVHELKSKELHLCIFKDAEFDDFDAAFSAVSAVNDALIGNVLTWCTSQGVGKLQHRKRKKTEDALLTDDEFAKEIEAPMEGAY